MMFVSAAALFGGWLLKAQCLKPWEGSRQYKALCYNDIQALYPDYQDERGDVVGRGVQARIFPYVEGELRPDDGALINGAIEYPVLTGVFMWGSGLLARDANQYFVHSALLLAPFGLLSTFLLARMTGVRTLLWAGAPAIVLYAFHNWDLLVVAATVAGFYVWRRGEPVWAAVLFGVGAALKMYPALFVAPVALERWRRGDRAGAGAVVGAGAGTFALINLPFVIRNFEGWRATYSFHSRRGPNFDSIWSITDIGPLSIPRLEPDQLNLLTTGLMLVFFAAVLGAGWWRGRRDGTYPVLPVSAALLASFLLWNKVHSPQYTLWLLPFFVLVAVPVAWWFAYTVVDMVVYVGIFRFFYDYTNDGEFFTTAYHAMSIGVWVRALLLLVLVVVFLRSDSSHPPDTVEPVGEAATTA
ncbi:MAG TPA: glycosyltransferase 87 family protein [Actinomycetota bacterium]|nr:glycosyltransferase 87 family protein [Actinomycetota bacterium]